MENETRDIIELTLGKKQKPNICKIEKSDLLQKVKNFLPELERSNNLLSEENNMENSNDDYHIQMVCLLNKGP